MLRQWVFTHGLTLSACLGYPLGKAVKLLRDSQRWSPEQMLMHQQKSLRALIQHCYDYVPYYADLMRSADLSPDDFRVIHDLAKLPCLTRDIIRREGTRLRATNYPDGLCQFRRSGGTTGEPIQVAVDARARAFAFGQERYNWETEVPTLLAAVTRALDKPRMRAA